MYVGCASIAKMCSEEQDLAILSKGGTTTGVGRSVIVAVVAIVGTTIETGYAQSLEQQCKWCTDSSNPDLAIGACTVVIQSGNRAQENLAVAFTSRGVALSL